MSGFRFAGLPEGSAHGKDVAEWLSQFVLSADRSGPGQDEQAGLFYLPIFALSRNMGIDHGSDQVS